MQTEQFIETVKKSLDNDLADLLYNNRVSAVDAMQLQMLRIMRGRPFKIELNAPSEPRTQGWSPDGVHFYPSEPGTFTTGGGPVPPEA